MNNNIRHSPAFTRTDTNEMLALEELQKFLLQEQPLNGCIQWQACFADVDFWTILPKLIGSLGLLTHCPLGDGQ